MSQRQGRKGFTAGDVGRDVSFESPEDPKRILAMAFELHQDGQLSRARALYREVLDRQPGNADALHFLGLLEHQRGDSADGERLIRRAIESAPAVAVYRDNLGSLLESTGRPDRALEQYESAERSEPGDPDRAFNIAVVHERLGDAASALSWYRRAIELRPGDAGFHFNLGNLLKSRGENEEAVEAYEDALVHAPDSAQVLNNLGNALHASGRIDDALAAWRRAIERAPADARAHANLAGALRAAGDLEGARGGYLRALELEPERAEHVQGLSATLAALGRFEEAADALATALGRDPDAPGLRRAFASVARFCEPAGRRADLGRAVALCLDAPEVSAQDLSGFAARVLRHEHGLDHAPERTDRLDALARDPVLRMLLARTVNVDPVLERALVALRRRLLLRAVEGESSDPDDLALAVAIGMQCDANEHVWPIAPDEADVAERLARSVPADAAPDPSLERSLAPISMVRPLATLGVAPVLAAAGEDAWSETMRPLVRRSLLDRLAEESIAARIRSIGDPGDETSRVVATRYEASPYPRWLSVPRVRAVDYASILARRFPHFSPPAALVGPVDVLAAGCGTGQEAVAIACGRRVRSVIGLDLSRRSLAYALRMADAFSVDGIELVRGDLRDVARLERRFDVIECTGVLHHLADPVAGWRALRDVLAPEGVMKIGLYSRRARAPVNAARERIAAEGLDDGPETVRVFRERVLAAPAEDPISELVWSEDFYATSTCRDLLFHPCEHQVDVPWIAATLDALDLELIGFESPFPQLRADWLGANPHDPTMTDLEAWDRFENERPELFAGMYVLWCRRAGQG